MIVRRFETRRIGRILARELALPLVRTGATGARVFGRLARSSDRLQHWAAGYVEAAPPRDVRWTRARWVCVASLWLLLAYPLSVGPLCYAEGRGWLGPAAFGPLAIIYAPVRYAVERDLPLTGLLRWYGDRCRQWGAESR